MIWQNMNGSYYRLFLCTNSKEEIGELDYTSLEINKRFKTNDNKINFSICFYENGIALKEDKRYKLTKVAYLVLLISYDENNTEMYKEYFYIQEPQDNYQSGKTYKTIDCISESSIFFGKKYVNGYDDVTLLYDPTNTQPALLNYMLNQIYNIYTIGYINPEFLNLYRYFKYDNNYIEIFDDLTKQLNAVIEIDNFNSLINIYKAEEYGIETDIIISDKNLINDCNNQNKLQKYFNRVKFYGKDRLTFNNKNILGTNYLEDYSYFLDNGYFSPTLVTSYNNYLTLLNTKQGVYDTYVSQLDSLNASLLTKENELNTLKTQKIVLEDSMKAIKVSTTRNNSTYDSLYSQYTTKLSQISVKESEITTINNNIAVVNNNINILRNEISWETNFTLAERKELMRLTFEETITVDTIDDENVLLEYGKLYMQYKSKMPITLELDIIDISKIPEYKNWWTKLKVGNYCYVNVPDIGYDYEKLRILEINHNPIENSLSLVLSNLDNIETAFYNLTRNLFAQNNVDGKVLEANKDSYSEFSNEKDNLIYLGDSINTESNEILCDGMVINKRGFVGTDIGSNGILEYLNDKIVISRDNMATYRTLLSGNGLYLENNGTTGRVVISPNNNSAFQVDKNIGTVGSPNWKNTLYIDLNGNVVLDGGYIQLISSTVKSQVKISPDNPLLVQKNTGTIGSPVWSNVFTLDSNGNVVGNDATFNNTTIQGLFRTGNTGARVEIDQDGIKTFNNSGQLSGLVINKSTDNMFSDLKMYWNGSSYFTVFNNVGSVSLKVYTSPFLSSSGSSTTAEGFWDYAGSEIANKNWATTTFAPKIHDHNGVYAPLLHDHNGVYAPESHSHSQYLLGGGGTIQITTSGLVVVDSNGQAHNIFWD